MAVCHRLRTSQAHRGRRQFDPKRRDRWHAQLHVTGAGRGKEAADHGSGCIQPGCDPLRDADRPTAISCGDCSGHVAAGHRARTGASARPRPLDRRRPGNYLPHLPGQGSPAALRLSRCIGGRLGALAGRRTDQCEAPHVIDVAAHVAAAKLRRRRLDRGRWPGGRPLVRCHGMAGGHHSDAQLCRGRL